MMADLPPPPPLSGDARKALADAVLSLVENYTKDPNRNEKSLDRDMRALMALDPDFSEVNPQRLGNILYRGNQYVVEFMLPHLPPAALQDTLLNALRQGNFHLAERLIDRGADVNDPEIAANILQEKRMQPFVFLLDHGMNGKSVTGNGRTLYLQAVEHRWAEGMEILDARKLGPHDWNPGKIEPFSCVNSTGYWWDLQPVLEALHKAGFDPVAADENGDTLFLRLGYADDEMIQFLTGIGVPLDGRDK